MVSYGTASQPKQNIQHILVLILAPLATVGGLLQISEHTSGAKYCSPLDGGRSVGVAVNVADEKQLHSNGEQIAHITARRITHPLWK